MLSFMPSVLEIRCEACQDSYTMKAYDIPGAYELLKQHIDIYHHNDATSALAENEYLHRKSDRKSVV